MMHRAFGHPQGCASNREVGQSCLAISLSLASDLAGINQRYRVIAIVRQGAVRLTHHYMQRDKKAPSFSLFHFTYK
jgi:hypothetical protein